MKEVVRICPYNCSFETIIAQFLQQINFFWILTKEMTEK